ncbi:hypothetical protein CLF_101565 [Clonorchis sinensis]|uniref:Uncharacterized protein n=1 Tax=Clonorchis sinensis TaxID=79923 RepID=G7Y618_CLOSI|nr:hypothetical protein CLF_101565 [Clonorchis sinensis]
MSPQKAKPEVGCPGLHTIPVGTPGHNSPMTIDTGRNAPITQSVALIHQSYRPQCVATQFPNNLNMSSPPGLGCMSMLSRFPVIETVAAGTNVPMALWRRPWTEHVLRYGTVLQLPQTCEGLGKLLPEVNTSSSVRLGCPLPTFIYNFVVHTTRDDSIPTSDTCGVEVLPGHSLTDINNTALIGSDLKLITLHELWKLGHVLRTPVDRIPPRSILKEPPALVYLDVTQLGPAFTHQSSVTHLSDSGRRKATAELIPEKQDSPIYRRRDSFLTKASTTLIMNYFRTPTLERVVVIRFDCRRFSKSLHSDIVRFMKTLLKVDIK